MRIVVLPFNAAANTRAALARQFANFACDIVRGITEGDVNAVNYLARVDESGTPRFALVNPGEELNDLEMIAQFQQQGEFDLLVDGLLTEHDGGGTLIARYFEKGAKEPSKQAEYTWKPGDPFAAVRGFVSELLLRTGGTMPDELKENMGLFGTENEAAFLAFLEGFDAIQYIEKSQGQVLPDFTPTPAMETLLGAVKADADWEAPYMAAIQLSRIAIQHRIGVANELEAQLIKLTELEPKDGRGWFALGELYQAIGNNLKASEVFEKAHLLEPDEPAILTRLGLAQMGAGMPVNAERNFRKAVEMEDEEKPTMDLLANVLTETGRAHEVPVLWKEILDKNPTNATAHAKYAISLLQAGREEDAKKAFEEGIANIEDNTVIKRYYAPYLNQKGDLDKAMDYYEDCLDVAPTDISILLEYARTLQAAKREFEVPKVLKDVLNANPDPNTRAQTLAWLIELEQPKRIEAVQAATLKLEGGDANAAIDELKPLRNWLADYWKLWAVLSAAYNRAGKPEDAEESCKRLLELFPGCEPGYGELVTALGAQSRHDEAYAIMRNAMAHMQGNVNIAVNLALAASRAGRVDEARALARQIREAVGPNEQLDAALSEVGI